MFNRAVFKQDLQINQKTILICYLCQFISLLLASAIRNMRLIDIADIFWDTIPVVIVPMAMQFVLAYELVKKRERDKTLAFILSTAIEPSAAILTKAAFMMANTFVLFSASMFYGCITHVYDLTGVWNANTYIVLNLGGMCLQLFTGGWCFLISCADKERKPFFYWIAGPGVLLFFYGIYLLYYLFPQAFALQFFTIFGLFQQQMFAKGSMLVLPCCVLLGAGGLALFGLGRYLFCKRGLYV